VETVTVPIFEVNGQWYMVGNRTLNSLNVSSNGITDGGLKALIDVVMEQEAAADQAPEGLLGLFRVILHVTKN
jgi:hypothetical protein